MANSPTAVSDPPRNPYVRQSLHIAHLWHRRELGKHVRGIERWVLMLHALLLIAMPSTFVHWLGWLGEHRGHHTYQPFTEAYAVGKPAVLLLILATGWASQSWALFLAILLAVDLNAYLFGVVLFSNFWVRPASYPRSVILLAFDLVEFIAAFAVIYIHAQCLNLPTGAHVTTGLDALYFSTTATTTVGFGDITPAPGLGRAIVTAQMLLALGFLVVVVSHFISTVGRNRPPPEEQ